MVNFYLIFLCIMWRTNNNETITYLKILNMKAITLAMILVKHNDDGRIFDKAFFVVVY